MTPAEGIGLSIITVVRNGAATLRECLESVLAQTRRPEHIVIDGASTDGTMEIVEAYRPGLAAIVSEPDRGSYEAMNKGLALARGEVVGFLHADDVYASPDILAGVSGVFEDPGVDSCYGDLVYVDRRKPGRVTRYWRSGPYDPRRFYWGWMPPHPTFFARRRVYLEHGVFNPSLGSAADYELMLRFFLKGGISAAYLPEVLVRMRSGGMSNASLANRIAAHRMDREAWRLNGLRPLPWSVAMKPLRKIGQFMYRYGRAGAL